MFFIIVVITVAVAGILYYVFFQSNSGGRNSWVQFFSRGKDAGFSFKELELLRRLAVSCQIEEPASVFESQPQLDACIRNLARSARQSAGADQAAQDFLSKLYDYRKKLEIEKNEEKVSLSDSRQIMEGQAVRVLVAGQGTFASRVIKNTGDCLFIERPATPPFSGGFSWNGHKLSVYFWREDDAGYVFDTDVQDTVFTGGKASLRLSHGASLFRTQKRKSVRIKTHKTAFLYVLEGQEPSDTIELTPGLKSIIEDLSDTGYAVTVGGKAAVGLRVKVQFILNNTPICVSGTVRSLEYNAEKNRSLLHVEADPLSLENRNQILGEVFGMSGEDGVEDDLPFRILGNGPSVDGAGDDKNGEQMEQHAKKEAENQSGVGDHVLY